jgi:hypothetical protein
VKHLPRYELDTTNDRRQARILRDNHRAHDGSLPPRRLHDRELLKPG